jgi:hypothetical protein
MSLTISRPGLAAGVPANYDLGLIKLVICNATFPNSYNTGGESLTPANVGLDSILAVIPLGTTDGGTVASMVSYDYTAQKLQAFQVAAVGTHAHTLGHTHTLDFDHLHSGPAHTHGVPSGTDAGGGTTATGGAAAVGAASTGSGTTSAASTGSTNATGAVGAGSFAEAAGSANLSTLTARLLIIGR